MGETYGEESAWIKLHPEIKHRFLREFACPKCNRTGIWKEIVWPRSEDDLIDADCKICDYHLYLEFDKLHLAKQDMHEKELRINQHLASKGLTNKAPWETQYYNYPCPYCGKFKVRNAKWEDKGFSAAFWGAFSYKLHCRYKCDACKQMWE